ncbi:helix-turn-helix transcriptional regulator [Cellulomonas hominis]
MRRSYTYSPSTREAARVLGLQIAAGRRERRWTVRELAERVGASEPTVRSIERGEPTVAVGLMFEAATLVGIPLFSVDRTELSTLVATTRERLALLPARVRTREAENVDDDF